MDRLLNALVDALLPFIPVLVTAFVGVITAWLWLRIAMINAVRHAIATSEAVDSDDETRVQIASKSLARTLVGRLMPDTVRTHKVREAQKKLRDSGRPKAP